MEDLLRSFWAVWGRISEVAPNFSEVAFMWTSPDATHFGQLLRSLLQNPWNFSEVAPEVRPAVHAAPLRLRLTLLHNVSEFFRDGETTIKMKTRVFERGVWRWGDRGRNIVQKRCFFLGNARTIIRRK